MFDLTAKHIVYFFLLLALLLGVALRLHHLGYKSFWGDEIWTAQVAERSLDYILAHTGVVPGHWFAPLYLAMAHYFVLFAGPGEFTIRLPALIFGILTLPMIYRLGRLFYGKVAGLVAALLLAVSPYHLWYSQDARWYSQVALFSVVSLFFFYRFILPEDDARKSRIKDGAGFVLGTVFTFYSHLFAFLILVAQGLFAGYVWLRTWVIGREKAVWFGHSSRLFILRFSLIIILIVLLTLPLLLPVLAPTSTSTPTSPGRTTFSVNFNLRELDFASTMRFIGGLLVNYGSGNRTVVYLFAGLFLLGLLFTAREQPHLMILVSLWLVAPFLTRLLWQSNVGMIPRYVIFLFPVYLVVVARGIVILSGWLYRYIRSRYFPGDQHPVTKEQWLSQQPIIGICLVSVIILVVLQLPAIRLDYLQGKQNDWRGLARYMEQHVQPGDVIVGEAWFQAAFTYYFNRSGDVSIINVLVIEEAMPILKNLIETERRVWAVVIPNVSFKGDEDLRGLTVDFIRENFSRLVDRKEWEDPNFVFIFPQDSYFTFPISEPLAKVYFHDSTTPAQIEFVDIRDAKWTTENHRSISPGTMTRLYLQMAASRPRLLKLTYFDFPDKDLQVLVDGQVVGEVTGGTSAAWKTHQAMVPPSAGDEALVSLVANGTEAVGVSKIWLEYMPAEVKFEEVTDADWTTESYKDIAPGESYQGWLALEASTPRQLKLIYFDFPGKDLRVLIDGQVAGEIAGGNSATWKTYTVAIPPASGDEVVFTLENPGHEAFGVSKVWLEYTLE